MGFGVGSLALRLQQQYAAVQKQLQRFVPPPAGFGVIARSLTHEQARDLVLHYWVNSVITMDRFPECDGNGNVTWPKPTDKVILKLNIAGVKFTPDNPEASAWVQTRGLDLRNVVMVVRLTQYLKDRWGVSVIFWGGLGIGSGKQPKDTHTEGLAMDFHGAITSFGHFDVDRDWGSKPVPAAIGGVDGGWPPTAKKTSYRLAVNPLDFAGLARSAVSPAGFFWDVYQYMTTQARHDSTEPKPRIGEGSGIHHPDTSWSDYLRKGHKNHFHFEVAAVK